MKRLCLIIPAAAAMAVWAQSPPSLWSRLERMDRDGDGKVSRSEFAGPVQLFLRLDQNGDGFITKEEVENAPGQGQGRAGPGAAERGSAGRVSEVLFSKLDRDRDGKVSAEEWAVFFKKADTDGDGYLERAELEAAWRGDAVKDSAPPAENKNVE